MLWNALEAIRYTFYILIYLKKQAILLEARDKLSTRALKTVATALNVF